MKSIRWIRWWMRILPVFLLVMLSAPSASPAMRVAAAAVPYGETCTSHYGAPDDNARLTAALRNLRAYFADKGMVVEIITHSPRFIRADILKQGRKVDSILFDVRTGRIRSVN